MIIQGIKWPIFSCVYCLLGDAKNKNNSKWWYFVHVYNLYTVKRKIIGEDLFGESINFAIISSHQMKKYVPHQLSSNNISKLNLCQIVIF